MIYPRPLWVSCRILFTVIWPFSFGCRYLKGSELSVSESIMRGRLLMASAVATALGNPTENSGFVNLCVCVVVVGGLYLCVYFKAKWHS